MRFVVSGKQMSEADRYTIHTLGIPSLDLMERASASCVEEIEKVENIRNICVVCGAGNNGGDGFAIARMLREKGYDVLVSFIGNPQKLTEETKWQKEKYESIGGIIRNDYSDEHYDMIVDAIFGVGLSRDIGGKYKDTIISMNESSGYKMAVDISSGISSATGQILGIAFRADLTVTFQLEKLGHVLYPGKTLSGHVIVRDIGISADRLSKEEHLPYVMSALEHKSLLPVREPDSNKGSYGRLLIIAGSQGMAGAAYLNGMAAYTAGAGLVRLYTHESNRIILQELLPEAIITTYDEFEPEGLREACNWADHICIGSGLGINAVSEEILTYIMKETSLPTVIDADGLNLISGNQDLKDLISKGNYIFTPHMKEMSRLLHTTVSELKKDRIRLVQEFSDFYHVVVALKDSRTFVFTPKEHVYLNTSGNEGMAKGGSGDVLTGIIGGFLAQKNSLHNAAVNGVYYHGVSGDIAKSEKGSYSILARDLISNLHRAICELEDS